MMDRPDLDAGMFRSRMRVEAIEAPWGGGVNFLLSERTHDGRVCAVATSVTLEALDPDNPQAFEVPGPTFSLSKDEAGLLMDRLWQMGVRPSNQVGSVGEKHALERHLDDMRRLVEVSMDTTLPTPKATDGNGRMR